MSDDPTIYETVTAKLAAHMPQGVGTTAVDPAKVMTAKTGAIWVKDLEREYEFRGLGNGSVQTHRRRKAKATITLAALCYREAARHTDAAAAALHRMEEIRAGVEAAIESDEDLSLGGTVSWSLLKSDKTETWAQANGWCAGAVFVIEAQIRP